jgi:hypothetical protein
MAIEVKDVHVYTFIRLTVHGKDLPQLRGQHIFL